MAMGTGDVDRMGWVAWLGREGWMIFNDGRWAGVEMAVGRAIWGLAESCLRVHEWALLISCEKGSLSSNTLSHAILINQLLRNSTFEDPCVTTAELALRTQLFRMSTTPSTCP